eukprot:scaffold16542_cov74-Cyclotella_meneghiniana.AAC.7
MTERIERVCKQLEKNEPPVIIFSVAIFFSNNELLDRPQVYAYISINGPHDRDYFFESPLAWKRLGAALRGNKTLTVLKVGWGSDSDKDDEVEDNNYRMSTEGALCLREFYQEIQQCTLIQQLHFSLVSVNGGPVFDLSLFARNNNKLRNVVLGSIFPEPLRQGQSAMVAEAIGYCTALKSLDLTGCIFDDDPDTFANIIQACSRVEQLIFDEGGYEMSDIDLQFGAVIGLLQNPLSKLTHLNVERFQLDNNHMQPLSESLRHNTGLKNLRFFLNHDVEDFDLTPIKQLLCDTSSIESMKSSNHTMVNLSVMDCGGSYLYEYRTYQHLYIFINRCLVLNRNPNKEHVIHQKIFRFYFNGNFNLDTFLNMSVVLLPKVLGLVARAICYSEDDYGSEHEVGLNAVYRLVRNIPDLSNVSSRSNAGTKKPRIQY